jgi:hypothetical protein
MKLTTNRHRPAFRRCKCASCNRRREQARKQREATYGTDKEWGAESNDQTWG